MERKRAGKIDAADIVDAFIDLCQRVPLCAGVSWDPELDYYIVKMDDDCEVFPVALVIARRGKR